MSYQYDLEDYIGRGCEWCDGVIVKRKDGYAQCNECGVTDDPDAAPERGYDDLLADKCAADQRFHEAWLNKR